MFSMFNQIFKTFSTLFGALEHGANALNNVCLVGEEASGTWADEQRVIRQAKVAALAKQHGVKALTAA